MCDLSQLKKMETGPLSAGSNSSEKLKTSGFGVILVLLLLQNNSFMFLPITREGGCRAAAFLKVGINPDRLPDRIELSHGFFEISLNAVEDGHSIVIVMNTVGPVVANKF